MILHTWEWCSPGCDICVVCGVQQTADNPVSPECSGKTHKPSEVVVSRTDLEAALRAADGMLTRAEADAYDANAGARLRAVLDESSNT